MGLRLALSTILRLVAIVAIMIAIALTASGAGITCIFRGEIGSSSSTASCPDELEKQFKNLDIGRWHEIAKEGNGGERLYGQFVVFALQIIVALMIASLIVCSTACKSLKTAEVCIVSLLAIVTLVCAASEAWYASGFGVLDEGIGSGSAKAWVDFTVVSWALASTLLFAAGIILFVDSCLSRCGVDTHKYQGV